MEKLADHIYSAPEFEDGYVEVVVPKYPRPFHARGNRALHENLTEMVIGAEDAEFLSKLFAQAAELCRSRSRRSIRRE